LLSLLCCLICLSCACELPAQDWPAFRGPTGDGICVSAGRPPLEWHASPDKTANKNIKWRAALPRPANGSPIVSNGRVFLVCPKDNKGRRRALMCFDRENGRELWSRTVEFDKVMPTHKTNPHGGSTPTADGKRVVVWHASAGLYCYDFAGKQLWKRDLGEFRHRWGHGTSPVLHDGKVILHTGPGKRVFVTALDLASGETIWKTDEPLEGDGQDNAEGRLMGSWCTPFVVTARADRGSRRVRQILCTMPTRVVAYDPEDGRILWWCNGLSCKRGDLAYSSPVIVGNTCVVFGGYQGPELGIRLGGSGDVTRTHRLWRHPRRSSNVGSGVIVDGYLYRSAMRGFLVCIDPATGKQLWSERPAKGQIWGSIVYVAGYLFVTNQKGTTIVFRPDPEKLVVVARNELSEASNSTPAISDGEMFLRTHKHLYCIAAPVAERDAKATGARPTTRPTTRPATRPGSTSRPGSRRRLR
jgi:outer membrane protein assembly factor BamB